MVSKELIAASTKPLVLAVLSKGESYGYAIIQEVRQHSGGQLEWSEGMLYPVLHRMEKDKLILASWRVGENGRKRKYYRLSASGTRAIETERQHWFAVHETLATFWGAKECLTLSPQ
ncbi:PadR family transcriptional regulator [Aureliella helgolandensis]|uniref:Lineage-specific thermal regulator protein n=1 Tax=Aureliella helgolandensis TaxID=2527968 RepID=A0A518GG53_9BACT|nr:helix-turn-helix transcriptional regulator [Aureliella helgolandensis]QDV27581.1 lineage-specific thermal regulator protein [Aureliella helgolandensis]